MPKAIRARTAKIFRRGESIAVRSGVPIGRAMGIGLLGFSGLVGHSVLLLRVFMGLSGFSDFSGEAVGFQSLFPWLFR
jgi:hypothetical protein